MTKKHQSMVKKVGRIFLAHGVLGWELSRDCSGGKYQLRGNKRHIASSLRSVNVSL